MLARCPHQWKRRYADGDRRPPGIALLVGGSAHRGYEIAMEHKLTHHTDLRATDVVDAAVAAFDSHRTQEDITFTADEAARGSRIVIAETRDRIAALTHFWSLNVQPDYQPMSVEQEWRILLPKLGTALVGVTDMVTVNREVVDWKTGKRRISRRECDTSLQLTAYAFAFHKAYGEPPVNVRFEQLAEVEAATQRYNLVSVRSWRDYTCLLARCEQAVRLIRTGIFPPGLPGQWWCSQKWCGYASTCPYYNPERDRET